MSETKAKQQSKDSTASTMSEQEYECYAQWLESGEANVLSADVVKRSEWGSISHVVAEEAFSDPPTPDVVLVQMKGGSCDLSRVDVGFGAFSYRPTIGESIVMPANFATVFEGYGQFEIYTVAIRWGAVHRDLQLLSGRELLHFDAAHRRFRRDPLLEQLADLLWREQDATAESELYSESIVSMIVNRLLVVSAPALAETNCDRPTISKRHLRSVLDHLHAAESTTLEELARIAESSRFQFCRNFSKATGLTPHQYLIRIRVEKAKTLIARGQPLIVAALDAGFADQPHMSRHFKRVYGISPGQYNRECDR